VCCMPPIGIDLFWTSASRVVPIRNGKDCGNATGFFYVRGNRRFLVTNRHVVIDEKRNFYPDALRIRVHADSSDLRRNEDLLISLYDNAKQKLWLEHPQYGSHADIVCLSLEGILGSQHLVNLLKSDAFLPSDLVLTIGQDAVVLGFPLGFHDDVLNLPVLRSAMVSTPYPAGFRGMPFFLIDARLHEGISGSPVFTKPTSMFMDRSGSTRIFTGTPAFLIGIVSAALPPNLGDNPLGLYVVWFANLVEEIASQDTRI